MKRKESEERLDRKCFPSQVTLEFGVCQRESLSIDTQRHKRTCFLHHVLWNSSSEDIVLATRVIISETEYRKMKDAFGMMCLRYFSAHAMHCLFLPAHILYGYKLNVCSSCAMYDHS